MNYLKTSELANYVKRGDEIEEGDELYWIGVAKSLADAYCKQSIAITDYSKTIRLTRNGVGYLRNKPIHKITPQDTTTGVRIRPLGIDVEQSRTALGSWQDINIPSALEDIINKNTSRFEITTFFSTDYNRSFGGVSFRGSSAIREYEAIVEFTAGYLANTKLASAASSGASTIQVESTVAMTANRTYITLEDDTQEYKITAINGNILTISPALTSAYTIYSDVYQVVPEDIKRACGMIIEDRVTYPANTKRVTSKLDVLTDSFDRLNIDAIPVDAARILTKYKVI